MRTPRLWILIIGLLVPASVPGAQEPTLHGGLERIPAAWSGPADKVSAAGEQVSATPAVLYDNTVNTGPDFYAGQSGEEAIDDLHGVEWGALQAVSFEYYEPDTLAPPFRATVRIYRNPGGSDQSISLAGGPYVIDGLLPGRHLVEYTLPFYNVLLQETDLWMGVSFTSETAGLVVNAVPDVGTSHDYYLENGNFYYFGGKPKANFSMKVAVTRVTGVADDRSRPGLVLAAAPNPSPGRTTIDYELPVPGWVRIDVLDVRGRKVETLVNGEETAGFHAMVWDGRNSLGTPVADGIYFMRLAVGSKTRVQKVVVSR